MFLIGSPFNPKYAASVPLPRSSLIRKEITNLILEKKMKTVLLVDEASSKTGLFFLEEIASNTKEQKR
jgi:hypothetical protein